LRRLGGLGVQHGGFAIRRQFITVGFHVLHDAAAARLDASAKALDAAQS
jgi:hypothetical protein